MNYTFEETPLVFEFIGIKTSYDKYKFEERLGNLITKWYNKEPLTQEEDKELDQFRFFFHWTEDFSISVDTNVYVSFNNHYLENLNPVDFASINVGDTYSSSGSCRRGKDNEKLEIVDDKKYSKFDFELNDYFEIDRLEVNKKWVDVSGLDFKPEWDKYRESINDSIAKVKLEHLENSFQNGGTET